MIINSEKLKSVSQKILTAVDSNELSILTETLELKSTNNILYMNVTNKEYYARIKLELTDSEDFHATVNANLFLKLVAQITTTDIELSVNNNYLLVKGNGEYKLPLIFDNNALLELPEIKINNPVKTFNISTDILDSILTYNSKELLRGTISKPVQKLYYIDNQGAITFTSGACVNSFTLTEPIKILLNNRIVKLFKLFDNGDVKFTLGYDNISDDIIQTKVKFETSDIVLTAIISCDDTLLNSVPVSGIRNRANNNYEFSVNIDKNLLLQTINRLMLFTAVKNTVKPYSLFRFEPNQVIVYDVDKDNNEKIPYTNSISGTYEATLDIVDLKAVLDNCSEQYITLNFGDHQAVILARGNIKNVIPEIRVI